MLFAATFWRTCVEHKDIFFLRNSKTTHVYIRKSLVSLYYFLTRTMKPPPHGHMIKIYTTPQKLNRTELRDFAKHRVAELWNTTLCHNQQGQPYLENGAHQISISHSNRFWAVAASREACGIDIELLSRQTEHLAHKYMDSSEMAFCHEALPQNPTLLCWCIKEALFKKFSRTEVDFKQDLRVTGKGCANELECVAFEQKCAIEWRIEGELLVVWTI